MEKKSNVNHNGHRLGWNVEKTGYISEGGFLDPWDGDPYEHDYYLYPE